MRRSQRAARWAAARTLFRPLFSPAGQFAGRAARNFSGRRTGHRFAGGWCGLCVAFDMLQPRSTCGSRASHFYVTAKLIFNFFELSPESQAIALKPLVRLRAIEFPAFLSSYDRHKSTAKNWASAHLSTIRANKSLKQLVQAQIVKSSPTFADG